MPAPFKRLLVANRGEVAVRIAETCRRLGTSPVGIYSEGDAGAPWLDAFDQTVCVGPAHPGKSYLDQSAVLQAAVQTDCQALHPGWGFLAENALFAQRVRQLRIAWVGPSPQAIRLMGDKASARETMDRLGLPTIPGSDGLLDDVDDARRLADSIGYPVLLKATAGGGGKGMRLCRSEADLNDAFQQAQSEAAASFGDAGLYMEKYIERGRHIEFQIMADRYGNAIHVGERECSVQRRHQKLIEEAPSPVIEDELRESFGRQVADAVARLGYEGAGTIEMLRASSGELYFMEMNTRLQVEHPVSELITGLDLVELQLEVASNRPLKISQDDVQFSGHAIEARLNAEDVVADFQPTPGPIETFDIPTDKGPGTTRVDTHVSAPMTVPPFYDSLLAKVITHGADREQARKTLIAALSAAKIETVPTTIPAHLKILELEDFVSGSYDTGILEQLTLDAKE